MAKQKAPRKPATKKPGAKAATKKPNGKKATGKKPSKKVPDPLGPATVWVDRWATDPYTGKRFRLILHRLPGKGKIDPELIRQAVIKVRDERLAREKQLQEQQQAGTTPE